MGVSSSKKLYINNLDSYFLIGVETVPGKKAIDSSLIL